MDDRLSRVDTDCHIRVINRIAQAHLQGEFRRSLNNISEWRKKRLAKLRTKDTS